MTLNEMNAIILKRLDELARYNGMRPGVDYIYNEESQYLYVGTEIQRNDFNEVVNFGTGMLIKGLKENELNQGQIRIDRATKRQHGHNKKPARIFFPEVENFEKMSEEAREELIEKYFTYMLQTNILQRQGTYIYSFVISDQLKKYNYPIIKEEMSAHDLYNKLYDERVKLEAITSQAKGILDTNKKMHSESTKEEVDRWYVANKLKNHL